MALMVWRKMMIGVAKATVMILEQGFMIVGLGRWLARDPKEAKYPNFSPYASIENSPILYIDSSGEDVIISTIVNQQIFLRDIEENLGPVFDKNNTLQLNRHTETEMFVGSLGGDARELYYGLTNLMSSNEVTEIVKIKKIKSKPIKERNYDEDYPK